jgi:hypothetical protein
VAARRDQQPGVRLVDAMDVRGMTPALWVRLAWLVVGAVVLGGLGMVILRGRHPVDPRTWWRWLRCWGQCPHRPYEDAEGCGGQCVRCGKITGYVTWAELRAYADRHVPAYSERSPVVDLTTPYR